MGWPGLIGTPEAIGETLVGQIVHVRDEDAQTCRAAIVVVAGDNGELRCRVLYPAPVTEPAGSRDAENWYPFAMDRKSVANPDGTRRWLDSWHPLSDHLDY